MLDWNQPQESEVLRGLGGLPGPIALEGPCLPFDQLSGIAFESFCYLLLKHERGEDVYLGPSQNDLGRDVAYRVSDGYVLLQCKRYKSQVGSQVIEDEIRKIALNVAAGKLPAPAEIAFYVSSKVSPKAVELTWSFQDKDKWCEFLGDLAPRLAESWLPKISFEIGIELTTRAIEHPRIIEQFFRVRTVLLDEGIAHVGIQTHPVALSVDEWTVPRQELDELCTWWNSKSSVCTISGFGGTGKTTLAFRFLALLPGGRSVDTLEPDTALKPVDSALVFRCSCASPEEIFRKIIQWTIGSENEVRPTADDVVRALRSLPAEGRTLLVFDELEHYQAAREGPDVGMLIDNGIADLIGCVAKGWLGNVWILATTRLPIRNGRLDEHGNYRRIELDTYSTAEAVQYLRSRQIDTTGATLRFVAELNGHHPLLLRVYADQFLAGYVQLESALDIRGSLQDNRTGVETGEQTPNNAGRSTAEILAFFEGVLGTLANTDPGALWLLQRLSVFSRPKQPEFIEAFAENARTQLGGEAPPSARIRPILAKLSRMSYLQASADARAFFVHPVIRTFLGASLRAEEARSWHELARKSVQRTMGNETADYDWLFGTSRASYSLQRVKIDKGHRRALEEVLTHTLEAGDAYEAWHIMEKRLGGWTNLGWCLGEYEQVHRIARSFRDNKGSLPIEAQKSLYVTLGCTLHNLGNLDEAIQAYEMASELADRLGDLDTTITCHRNIAYSYLLLGRIRDARHAAEQALNHAEANLKSDSEAYWRRVCNDWQRSAGDADDRATVLAYMAYCDSIAGDLQNAQALFRRSLDTQNEADGMARANGAEVKDKAKSESPLYSERAVYRALHLHRLGGQSDEAFQAIAEAVEKLEQCYGAKHHDIPKLDLALAEHCIEKGDATKANKHIERAARWANEHAAPEPLCRSFIARVRSALALTESANVATFAVLRNAVGYAEEGLVIAREHSLSLCHVDLANLRSRALLQLGELSAAEESARIALSGLSEEDSSQTVPRDDLSAYDRACYAPIAPRATVLGSEDPKCGYAWGEADARFLIAQALLDQAAKLNGGPFLSEESSQGVLHEQTRLLISKGRDQLLQCRGIRERLHHEASMREVNDALARLDEGVLTTRITPPLLPPS